MDAGSVVAVGAASVDSTLRLRVSVSIVAETLMLLPWTCGSVASPGAHERFASATIVQALIFMASFGVVLALFPPEVNAFAAAKALLGGKLPLAVVARVASPSLSRDAIGSL